MEAEERLDRLERLRAIVEPRLREVKKEADARRDHPAFYKSEAKK